MANPPVAGWREHIRIPDWDIEGLVAKLDTGAKSSCVDARGMEVIEGEDHGRVRFTVPTPDGDVDREEDILDWRNVRDSGGHVSLRPIIRLQFKLGDATLTDEATLHDRSDMQHRILIGRRALAGQFMVDPEQTFVLT